MPAGWGCYSIAFIVYFRQVLVQQGNSTFVLKVNTRDTKSVALTDIVLITFFITFESTQDSVQIFLCDFEHIRASWNCTGRLE